MSAGPINLDVGATTTIQITSQPAGLQGTWAVDNPGVATISTAGPSTSVTVTGVAAGTATVTCSLFGAGGKTVSYAFKVIPAVEDTGYQQYIVQVIPPTPQSISMNVGDSRQLYANASGVDPMATTWATSDPTICSIGSAGPAASIKVTAVGPGTATITASNGGLTATEKVKVINPLTFATLTVQAGN